MTTGTKTVDLRTYKTRTDCGDGLSGYWSSKTWSGGDWVVKPQTSDVKREKVLTFKRLVPHISRKGKRYYTVEKETRLVTTYRRVSPKRIATNEEHAYTMQFEARNDALIPYRYGTVGPILWGWSNLCGWGHNPPASSWTADDDYKLIGKLKSRFEGTSDFHLGKFLGESPKALQMIGDAAFRISTAMRFARKGDLLRAENALVRGRISRAGLSKRKGAANNWLELQYGWLPLLNDAHNGAEMLAHLFNAPQQSVVKVSRRKAWGLGSFSGGATARKYTSFQQKSIKCIITEVNHAQMSGLTDPLSIAWELMPWSFVADWFIPIGNFLEARSVVSSVSGKFVTSYFRRLEINGLKASGNPSNLTIWSNGYSKKNILLDRTVSSSLANPLPTFRPLSEVLGWRRAANAVALLTQRTVKG